MTLSAFAGTTTAILWPRDVTWQLTNLDVKDESSLMFFVMAFGKGMTNDTKLPDLVFLAGANLENPNFLGGTAMSGEFQVLYHDQVLGGGRSEPVQVPALGTGMVQVWGCLGMFGDTAQKSVVVFYRFLIHAFSLFRSNIYEID